MTCSINRNTISLSAKMLLALLIITTTVFAQIAPPVTTHEIYALQDFYVSTDGPNWSIGSGTPWNFTNIDSQNPCADPVWYGVVCTDNAEYSFVSELNLRNSLLRGLFPSSLVNLTHLTILDLTNNYIDGTLSSRLSSLPLLFNISLAFNFIAGKLPGNLPEFLNLSVLDVYGNFMEGTIPSNIAKMPQITELFLGDNHFIGTIPSEIGQLTQLTKLDLEINEFMGTIPPEIGNITTLQFFIVAENKLSGSLPTELGNLTDLSKFIVDRNRINGTVPSTLGNLSNLQELSVYGNHISGTIPLALCKLTQLKVLNLYNNNMTGTLPPELGQMTDLIGLKLSFNQFIGPIPTTLGYLSQLQFLYLANNYLTNTIPASLGNLVHLKYLDIYSNNLNGTIPNEIMNCSELIELALNSNNLTGTIPQNIGNLHSLENLFLYSNHFSGSIPASIGNLSNLLVLVIYQNEFSNSIPKEIGQLTKLTQLALYENNLNGTLPSEIGNMTDLQLIDLKANSITGSLPPSFGQLSNLYELVIYSNLLTGIIPESYGNLTSLVYFYTQYNLMTGTIPASLCNLKSLNSWYVYDNYHTGALPNCMNNLTSLLELNIGNNLLTGSFPSSLTNLSSLNFLGLYGNILTGSLPDTFSTMIGLETFEIQVNVFTGIVPTSISNLPQLYSMQLSYNFFTGSLPNTFAYNSGLQSIDFGQNLLSGTVPSVFSQLAALSSLVLQNNTLSGSLTSVFNSTVQYALNYADLTYNQFTGEIPSEVFKIPTLQQFGLISNCMSGTIPVEICGANQLTTLLLDGLSAGSSCQSKIFPNIPASTSYYLTKHLTGHIPSCLFSAPALQTLHLSGNSITGSIASDVVLSPSLTALIISHNQLTGTLPSAIQKQNFSDLDMGFNKFKGVLDSSFGRSFSYNSNWITMEVNRFSGNIPASLTEAYNIQLVNGNMFSCGIVDRSSLPSYDKSSNNYQCGSNTLNLSMYFFAAVTALFFTITVLICVKMSYFDQTKWMSGKMNEIKQHYHNAIQIPFDNFIGQYIRLLTRYRQFMVAICITMLALLLPTYGTLSVFYSSYQYAYAWTVSAAFLSGLLPGCVLYVLWVVLIATLLVVVYHSCRNSHIEKHSRISSASNNSSISVNSSSAMTLRKRLYIALLLVVNLLVVSSINVLYVWVTLNADTPFDITVTEMFVALFKLVWNDLVVPRLFIYAQATNHIYMMQLRVAILLFNNILAPCAATAVVSPNCFYYVFTNSQPVTTEVQFTTCQVFDSSGACSQTQYLSTEYSYLPPYIYSFQCSSTLVTNYASIFVYMYLIDAFVKPLYLAALRYAYVHWSVFRVIGDVLLPNIIKPMNAANLNVPNKPLVNKYMVVLSMINTCAILLTFGVVFPLLAVVIAVDVVVVTFSAQLLVGSVSRSGNATLLQQYSDMLNFECDGVESLLRSSVWVVVPVAAVFYSMFLFDTIGDAVGWQQALWAPLSIIFMPILVLAGMFTLSRKKRSGSGDQSNVGGVSIERESEMVSVSNNPLILVNKNHNVSCIERGSEF